MKYILSPFLLRCGEIFFIGCMVVTLPLWFPLIAVYTIVDPPYHLSRILSRINRLRRAKALFRSADSLSSRQLYPNPVGWN